MPGYQPVRIMQPVDYFPKNESIYGHIKSKKKSKGAHPLFEDLKTRNVREKMDYDRYIRSRDMVRSDPNGNRFDSLKLVASCNDIQYLDTFMSIPLNNRAQMAQEDNEPRLRNNRSLAKSSTAIFAKGGNNGDKRNSIHNDSNAITAAMMNSLRSCSSEDNLYESMEMIHYLKTMKNLNHARKTRSIQKTGHPLFDSLREEQAMKEPTRKTSTSKKPFDEQAMQGLRSHDYMTSDGNSPSHSSSSSGDEYEIYPRMVAKTTKMSRHKVMQQQQQQSTMPHRRYSEPVQPSHFVHQQIRQEKQKTHQKKKRSDNNASDSDDEFKIIPRPRLVGKGLLMQQQPQKPSRRRSVASPPSDESDSSFNSAVLR